MGELINLNTSAPILTKILTGTTPTSQNSYTSIPHGVTASKIVGMTAKVVSVSGAGILPSSLAGNPGFQFDLTHDTANAFILLSPSNSGSIVGKPVTVLVFYTN